MYACNKNYIKSKYSWINCEKLYPKDIDIIIEYLNIALQ